MSEGWEAELERYLAQRELFSQLQETVWVPLARAEVEAGVSRSALRAWYRSGEIPSRLVDSPHGPQRIVPLDAVLERAARSPRLRRRAERDLALTDEVAALRQRLDQVELRLAALEADGHGTTRPASPGSGSGSGAGPISSSPGSGAS